MFFKVFLFLSAILGCSLGVPSKKLDPRVVGGILAEDGAYPYQASIGLRFTIPPIRTHMCGGSIITSRTIVTAAHCFEHGPVAKLIALVGTNSIKEGGVMYDASGVIVHPEYDSIKTINDIGLMILQIDIEFNNKVAPIPLGYEEIGTDVTTTLTGWGATIFPGNPVPDLRMIDLQTISFEKCKKEMELLGEIFPTQICTFTKTGEGSCQGDSGGPLAANGKLVGIVSWGYPCAQGYPDIFTRISSYTDWIDKNKV